MASELTAFAPLYLPLLAGANAGVYPSVHVAATTTAAASAQFSGVQSRNPKVQIRVSNTTNQWAYVEFGDLVMGAVRAATVANSLPVAPGSVEIFTVSSAVNGASVILSAASTGGTDVIFTRGEGL